MRNYNKESSGSEKSQGHSRKEKNVGTPKTNAVVKQNC